MTTGRMSIARFAAAAKRLNEQRAMLGEIRDLVSSMERTRLVPLVAEQELIQKMDHLVLRANDQITQMASGIAAQNRACMVVLESLVERPEWHVAKATLVELKKRRLELDEFVRNLTEERRAYRLPFQRFHKAVERATQLRIEVSPDDKQLATEVENRFRSSELDFTAGRFDTAAVAQEIVRTLLKEHNLEQPEDFENHTEQIESKVADREEVERKMGRRAELFLISGPLVDKDVPYKVMLRRPGYQHIQETNLYDDVVVLKMDQELFRDTIDRLAENAIEGIRSATDPTSVRRARPQRSGSPEHLDQLDPEKRLEKIGRRMYSLLIPDAMQRLIDETPGFPLTITSNNPELPWELMHDGRQYVCLERMFARMPTGQTFPRRSRDTGVQGGTQTRVLLISSASEQDLPQAKEEVDEIEAELRSMTPQQVAVTKIAGTEVTSSRLTDELSLGNYDLVHYAGHAGFDSARPELSYLLLPNGEKFRAERVQRLLEGHPVVFLNACESSKAGPQAPGGSTSGIVAQSQGLAAAFVYGGAQACVGSLWPVFDDTARAFANEFYRQLIKESQRVGEALREARVSSRETQKDRVTWAAYALYGEPSYRLGADWVTAWVPPN
ncbi:MAG: CHAT domain-containing protein [Streptosporangiaceae bacterium]